jgi:hypothetical protein
MDRNGANRGNRQKLEGPFDNRRGHSGYQQPSHPGSNRSTRGGDKMSTANFVVGMSLAAAVTQATLTLILPEAPPIDVHSLTYKDGLVYQDRTVTADSDYFPAEWRASIVDHLTRIPVDGCVGSGFWNYPAGRKVAEVPLTEWVGSDTCTPEYLRGLGGEFYAVASWHYGNSSTIATGEPFKP